LNTPHNPLGKVFPRDELDALADVCRRRGLVVIADEAYEHLVYDGAHVPIATLPGMRERTMMISSAGKTFGFTGWKIGYACAPRGLTGPLRLVHQFVTFTNGTPFQHAVAEGLAAGDDYFRGFAAEYRARRDRLCDGLARLAFRVTPPAGTYFAIADLGDAADGDAFCRALPATKGVAAIPVSAFCADPGPFRGLVRFAFCKRDATLDEALRRLAAAP
jgi:N-succinyldiaminopimelate aminotransferase